MPGASAKTGLAACVVELKLQASLTRFLGQVKKLFSLLLKYSMIGA
jgi:hypothetical protein